MGHFIISPPCNWHWIPESFAPMTPTPHLHQQDLALDAGRHHTPIRTWSIGTSIGTSWEFPWESTAHRLETGSKQLPTPSSWLKQPETMGLRHCPAATHCLRWLEDFLKLSIRRYIGFLGHFSQTSLSFNIIYCHHCTPFVNMMNMAMA